MAESGRADETVMDDDFEADVPILAPGDMISPGYEVIEHLRRGKALDVYEVFSARRLCSCIAKTIRPDRAQAESVHARLLLEGHLLQTLAHPMLLRGFDTISEPRLVVIAETLKGPTLADLITERANRLPLSDLCHLGQHITAATQYLHESGYLHLDIRPSNIIAEQGLARVIDLSLARPPGMVRPGVGSARYLAPEQARGGMITPAADVWGIGATLYEAATRVRPFAPLDDDDQEVLDHQRYLQLHRPAPPITRWRRRLPPAFTRLIHACLEPDPDHRPSPLELWRSLEAVRKDTETAAVRSGLTRP
jgi:serine/threonine protein kinase